MFGGIESDSRPILENILDYTRHPVGIDVFKAVFPRLAAGFLAMEAAGRTEDIIAYYC